MRKLLMYSTGLVLFLGLTVAVQAQDSSTAVYEAYTEGKTKVAEKDYDAALEAFQKATEVGDPEKEYDANIIKAAKESMAVAAFNKAKMHRDAKEYEAAMDAYIIAMEMGEEVGNEKVVEFSKQNGTMVAFVLGNSMEDEGDAEKAIAIFDKGIQLDSTYYKNYYGKAQIQKEQGNIEEAITAYIQAANILASSEDEEEVSKSEGYHKMVISLIGQPMNSKDWEQLMTLASAYLAQVENSEAYYYMAVASRETGDATKAVEYADKAIELAGEDSDMNKYNMAKAEALEKAGQVEAAIVAYKTVGGDYAERAKYKVNELSGGN